MSVIPSIVQVTIPLENYTLEVPVGSRILGVTHVEYTDTQTIHFLWMAGRDYEQLHFVYFEHPGIVPDEWLPFFLAIVMYEVYEDYAIGPSQVRCMAHKYLFAATGQQLSQRLYDIELLKYKPISSE